MLSDQIALVTGASRGIGRAIALALGAQQATVIGTATTQAGADGISASLAENGIRGIGLALDVSNPESVSECLKRIGDEFGAPDILVNNAGITRDTLLMTMKDRAELTLPAQGGDRQHQPEFGLPHVQGGHPADDEEAQRAHHQHLVGGRCDR